MDVVGAAEVVAREDGLELRNAVCVRLLDPRRAVRLRFAASLLLPLLGDWMLE